MAKIFGEDDAKNCIEKSLSEEIKLLKIKESTPIQLTRVKISDDKQGEGKTEEGSTERSGVSQKTVLAPIQSLDQVRDSEQAEDETIAKKGCDCKINNCAVLKTKNVGRNCDCWNKYERKCTEYCCCKDDDRCQNPYKIY
jgi:hypothetical protein